MSEFNPYPSETTPRPKPEADPRLEKVASLQVGIKESEGDFTIIGYGSNPRERASYWVVHVMYEGKIISETSVPRLDLGNIFSHNDLVRLYQVIDQLKQQLNSSLDVHTNI